jgi:hypothetical protein
MLFRGSPVPSPQLSSEGQHDGHDRELKIEVLLPLTYIAQRERVMAESERQPRTRSSFSSGRCNKQGLCATS